MTNLNELATKLQSYLINSQMDAHNRRNFSKSRYNNLKIRISTQLEYPNIIVSIGISEATYNIEDCTKTDGSLGPDEKYIYKWIGLPNIQPLLKECYLEMTEMVDLQEEQTDKAQELEEELMGDMEGIAGESNIDDRPSRRSRSNFRNLIMPSEYIKLEQEAMHRKEDLMRREDMPLTPLETVSSDFEEYNEAADLEIYQEQQLESLEDSSKRHSLFNLVQNMFGARKQSQKDDE